MNRAIAWSMVGATLLLGAAAALVIAAPERDGGPVFIEGSRELGSMAAGEWNSQYLGIRRQNSKKGPDFAGAVIAERSCFFNSCPTIDATHPPANAPAPIPGQAVFCEEKLPHS